MSDATETPAPSAWTFDPAKRKIFEYHDGTRSRRADPLAVQRVINRKLGRRLDTHLKNMGVLERVPPALRPHLSEGVIDDMRAKEFDAAEALAAVTREAFGVKALEDGGLSDAECLDLFARFYAYVAYLEEAARPLPDSPGPDVPSTPAG